MWSWSWALITFPRPLNNLSSLYIFRQFSISSFKILVPFPQAYLARERWDLRTAPLHACEDVVCVMTRTLHVIPVTSAVTPLNQSNITLWWRHWVTGHHVVVSSFSHRTSCCDVDVVIESLGITLRITVHCALAKYARNHHTTTGAAIKLVVMLY